MTANTARAAGLQVSGTHVDKRADIWAYGVVVYELLAGKRAFTGATVTDILAASLRAELDWTALPANTPRDLRRQSAELHARAGR